MATTYAARAAKDPFLGASPYPSDRELRRIARWPAIGEEGGLKELFSYVEKRWSLDYGKWEHVTNEDSDPALRLVTGGWSGNEELIGALQQNIVAWGMTWQSSTRGGLHIFEIPKFAR